MPYGLYMLGHSQLQKNSYPPFKLSHEHSRQRTYLPLERFIGDGDQLTDQDIAVPFDCTHSPLEPEPQESCILY